MDKVTVEFTTEYQFNVGTWFTPGTRLVMKSNVADWFVRRELAKVVSKPKRKAKKSDDNVDSGSDGSPG